MNLTLSDSWRLAVGATLACGAILLPSAALAASSAPATVPRCAAASLLVWAGPGQGAAGSVADEFGFTNRSASTCSLYGYPLVQMLKKSGKNLSTSDQKAPGAFSIQEKTVVLAPGKTAYFGVMYASQTGYANLICPTSAALRFTPPHDAGTVTLHGSHAQITPYGGTTQHLKCGIVHLTPVTANRFQ
ncbi:MAG: DUF4232 domain-containing protein [Acidimicrobiales bacterium]